MLVTFCKCISSCASYYLDNFEINLVKPLSVFLETIRKIAFLNLNLDTIRINHIFSIYNVKCVFPKIVLFSFDQFLKL